MGSEMCIRDRVYIMNMDWLNDGRKIPDDAMFYIRGLAVHAVRVLGQSPELVSIIYNFSRTCIYDWLKQYDEGGFEALESKMSPSAKPIITSSIDEWIKKTILSCTPVQFGYDTNLWTSIILVDLLKQEFNITVSDSCLLYTSPSPRDGLLSRMPSSA